MKRSIYFLMLLTGITGKAYAQQQQPVSKEDRVFDLSAQDVNRRFLISLDKGDKMQIELTDFKDLQRINNVDSLLKLFLHDVKPLKDSLSDELTVKRIDYVTEPPAARKIRIRQSRPAGNSYLIQQQEVAALKLEQDTVNILGIVDVPGNNHVHRFRVSFFVNRLEDLSTYADGRLNARITSLKENAFSDWVKDKDGMMHVRKDYTISAKMPGGSIAGHGDYLVFSPSVAMQNYKHYFLPSFSLGATVVFGSFMSNNRNAHELGIYWEPSFFFGKDNNGKLKTFRNDFLTLSYGVGPAKREENKKDAYLQYMFSVGYLIHRSGDYMDKNSFRVGVGRMVLFQGKTKIEPVLYFNDLFKGVTPGIRIIQGF